MSTFELSTLYTLLDLQNKEIERLKNLCVYDQTISVDGDEMTVQQAINSWADDIKYMLRLKHEVARLRQQMRDAREYLEEA